MRNAPQWVVKILDMLGGCVECYSAGSLDIEFDAEDSHLVCAPAMTEVAGGAEDGNQVFPFFSVHLAELSKAFDSAPEMSWDTMHDDLHVEGEIDGEDAWITIQKFPFEGEDRPGWVIDGGTIRRREDQD